MDLFRLVNQDKAKEKKVLETLSPLRKLNKRIVPDLCGSDLSTDSDNISRGEELSVSDL